ncbi:MAG: alpha,alpha-trehalose-phosphate synthase (UDP-forming) [Minwuia sp.]|uniref:alpha,alpha-trehalose-phosphate synthase (UDP-forming) n=1 Tax=Minwuia sp. TaxID=2493630 RepID=UPI003A885753
MSRLIAVSNRVSDPTAGAQSGGLAVALGEALQESSGLWFGWNGDVVVKGDEEAPEISQAGKVTLATFPLSPREYRKYYLDYANQALWPVCHYRLDLAEFDPAGLDVYKAVNRRFASMLAKLVQPDDLIWIHDYHLIPLAAELRRMGCNNRIGFFLHIPFPPPEIVSAIPRHEFIIDSLFAYDVVGFQTDQHVENFKRYAADTADGIDAIDHPFRSMRRMPLARSFPIGIDPDAFRQMATTPEAEDRIRRFQRGGIRNHIIGVDRLDYSKGLPDRFLAYHRMLDRFSEHHKTTILTQIAPPTREELTAYADIRSELERLSGNINGEFGDFDWTPLRYIHRSVPREVLAALFRAARVGLVTPLQDGMNLVAKEYVAAQDEDDPGVLVLSRFAGAAADLKEALLVNPHDTDEMAGALHAALTMSLTERKERQAKLLERVRRNDIAAWRTSFLKALRGEADDEAA